jgi:hypothetical protein
LPLASTASPNGKLNGFLVAAKLADAKAKRHSSVDAIVRAKLDFMDSPWERC